MSIPGIGPLTAMAIAVRAAAGEALRCGPGFLSLGWPLFPGRARTGGMPKLGTIAKVSQCDLRRLLICRGDGDGPMGGAKRHEEPGAHSDAGAQAVQTRRRTAGQPDTHTPYRPRGSSEPAWPRYGSRSRVASFLLRTLVVSAAVLIPSTVPEFGMTVVTASQDEATVEAALSLDRPTRRLIQERLRNEGFDPGTADGLFRPRTRAAIRRWQEARELPATGYLDRAAADLLRGAGAPPAAVAASASPQPPSAEPVRRDPSATGEPAAPPARASMDCSEWNTQEFFEAATASDVTACLAAGSDVAAQDNDYSATPLHWAAWLNEDRAVIEALLAAGADVEARNSTGRGPLHNAGHNGNPEVAEALLAAGAEVGARDDTGETPLHHVAFGSANPAVVEALLAAGAEVGARDDTGETPLHHAAYGAANPAVVEALVAAGADVQGRTDKGETPLHLAAWSNGNPAVVELLVDAGLDVNARDNSNATPLHLALMNERFLIWWGSTNPDRVPNAAVVPALLAAGADLSARTGDEDEERRYTPLYVAARGEEWDLAKVLLAAGANPNDAVDGGLPLHRAAESTDDPTVIDALLDAGAEIDAVETRAFGPERRGRQMGTAVFAAASYGNAAVLRRLLAHGAGANTRIHNGISALHRAAGRNPAAIEMLLAAGANLEARDGWGKTPLHHAAESSGTGPEVSALLAAGANIEARDEDGNTPLHLAAEWQAYPERPPDSPINAIVEDAIKALLDGGANPNARNAAGRTPWDLAQQNDGLRDSDAYWRLNDARYNTAPQGSRRPVSTPRGRRLAGAVSRESLERACEIPGYPSPTDVQDVGVAWCGSTVGFQRRAFALQAAGAWCAIAQGTSSSAEQVNARHREINAACDALDALGAGGGPPCNCPAGYRP